MQAYRQDEDRQRISTALDGDYGDVPPAVPSAGPRPNLKASVAGPAVDSVQLFLRQVREQEFLSAKAETALLRRAQEGDRVAHGQLMSSHLPLVAAMARQFGNRGVPLLDLIQEGALGLDKAIRSFDWRYGARLSTYAIYAIHRALEQAAVNQASTIRLPMYIVRKRARVARYRDLLFNELGREPTAAEIGELVDLRAQDVEWLLFLIGRPVSLSKEIGDGAGIELGELLADDTAEHLGLDLERAEVSEIVAQLLSGLTRTERDVIELRYGFGRHEASSLQQIGDSLGLTRERVRQIQEQALEKLRRIAAARALHDALA